MHPPKSCSLSLEHTIATGFAFCFGLKGRKYLRVKAKPEKEGTSLYCTRRDSASETMPIGYAQGGGETALPISKQSGVDTATRRSLRVGRWAVQRPPCRGLIWCALNTAPCSQMFLAADNPGSGGELHV